MPKVWFCLLNQQDRSQLPEYLAYAVHQSLIGDKYFTSVNSVSIFTENLNGKFSEPTATIAYLGRSPRAIQDRYDRSYILSAASHRLDGYF